MKTYFTPKTINSLKDNEIFVFGSNMRGYHSGGGAFFAKTHFGAIEGQAEGLQGQSYAIPTVGQNLKGIKKSVELFCDFANKHRELTFLVTAVGCKNAGFSPEEIAPLFINVFYAPNVILPKDFAEVIVDKMDRHYSVHIDGFEYLITDIKNHKAIIGHAAPQYGYAHKVIEFAGEEYEVMGVDRTPYYRCSFSYISDSVNYIGKKAFFDTYSNDIFVIPKNLEFYGAVPFPHCEITSNSNRFKVVNGLVIDHKYKRVVQCINHLAEHVDVPEGIKEIYDGAFYKCHLRTIQLPSTLKNIDIDAFWDCRELENITIPKNVTYIGSYAFAYCERLKDVRLLGDKIKSGEFPFNRCNNMQLYILKGCRTKLAKTLHTTSLNDAIEY